MTGIDRCIYDWKSWTVNDLVTIYLLDATFSMFAFLRENLFIR
jgi:hypothetical protein